MFQKNSDLLLNSELNHILESVLPLLIDREYKIRKQINEFIKLMLDILLKNKNIVLLKPFYKLINAHLSCAMTHIDENIQYNSLIVLDIFIEHLPNMIYLHSYCIFENFIEQISKIASTTTHSNNNVSKTVQRRILKNDPYKLTSTQSWRSNVLSRLYKILLIVSNSAAGHFAEFKDSHNANEKQLFKFDELNELLFEKVNNTNSVAQETFKLR